MTMSNYGRFNGGVSVAGMPVLNTYSGKVIWVDSNGGGGSRGTFQHPVATIDLAMDLCTASKGDTIMVKAGHTETASTTITLDVAGVSIIGLGRGSNRPVLTAHASAVDLINVTADDVYIENLKLYYAASQTAFINIAADDFTAQNVWCYGAATPVSHVTVASGDRFGFYGCRFESETDGADYGIIIEADGIDGWTVKDCMFNFHSVGVDVAGIESSFETEGGLVENCRFIGMTAAAIDFNSSNVDGEGLIVNCHAAMLGAIAPANAIDPGGYVVSQCFASDDPDASAGHIPPTSDS